jgi:hypothetical protein
MGQAATIAAGRIRQMLADPSGVPYQVALLTDGKLDQLARMAGSQVGGLNIATELAERAMAARYPQFSVYCEKFANTLHEKFRRVSGRMRMVIEVRVSSDRLENLDGELHTNTDAALAVLESNRGDWGLGMFYGGTYEVTYGQIRAGGKRFTQSAKIAFDVEISAN